MLIWKYKNNKAFTITELIVVIIILAILWTISFISIQSYSRNARDSIRKTDVSNVVKSLEIFNAKSGFYPAPTDWTQITFSGAEVWTQGIIWKSVIDSVDSLTQEIYDPVTQTPYTYSRLNNKKRFQIATAIEWNVAFNHNWGVLIQESFASSGTVVNAYVKWNYNWVAAKVSTWEVAYVLAIPSIISSDLSITDVMEYMVNNKFVYHGYQNLPDNYRYSSYEIEGGEDDYLPNDIVVYSSGSFEDLENRNAQILLLSSLREAYSWSTVVNSDSLNTRILNTVVDLDNPSEEAEDLACNIWKYILDSWECSWSLTGALAGGWGSWWGWGSCDASPSIDNSILNTGSPSSENQAWVYDVDWTDDCSWMCDTGYEKWTWDECIIDESPYCDTQPIIDWAEFNEWDATSTGQVWIFDDSWTAACSWKCLDWKVKWAWDTCVTEGVITWVWGNWDWSNASNWDLGRVPEVADNVVIDMNVTVNLDTTWWVEIWSLFLWETATSTLTLSWLWNFTANWEVHIYTWDKITHDYNSSSKINALNLVTSNLTVDSWGSIDVWGKGYAMRQWEGLGVTYSSYGWGWAYGGNWGDWNSLAVWGSSYGSPSTPTYLGSGWGEDWGSWWGAMKIVVSWTLTINWDIKANWNNYSSSYWGGGAWGSIWLDAGILAWNWTISANWGNWYSNSWGWGGGGRIAVYYDSSAFPNGYMYTNPWLGWSSAENWWVGTLYIKNKSSSDESIYVRTTGTTTSTFTELTSTLNTLDYMYVGLWAYMLWELNIPNASLTVNNWWIITHRDNSTTKASTVDIIATNLTIDSGGTIDVSWLGYDKKQWEGSWWTYSSYGWWGAYGGNWGNWSSSAVWGTGYGSATGPNSLWSWGWEDWGSGGGSIKVDLSWNLTINWTIKADWNNYFSSYWGGGAWGSIWLDAGTLAWNWSISANWGNWYSSNWGWGGGWRVALYFNSATFDYTNNVSVDYWEGGTSAEDWGVWTIYTYNKSDTSEFLYVRNIWNTVITNTLTELEWSITSVKNIIVWGGAYVGEFNNVVASSSLQATNSMITTNASWEFNMPSASVTIWDWATLTHHANNDSKIYSIDLVASNLTVDSWGSIDVWGKGYAMRQWEGLGVTYSYYGWGWAYGGNWGDWNSLAVWGSSYGSPSTPTYLGSGWGEDWGSWWGAMKIVVSWTLTINWDIKANWNNYSSSYWGGGAWGSIWLDAGILAWNWTISANWGNWYSSNWGWGGGGRIAVYYDSSAFPNGYMYTNPWLGWSSAENWWVGTLYIKNKSSSDESIYVRTTGTTTSTFTELTSTLNTLDYMYVGLWAYMLWELNIPNASLTVNNWWIITHRDNSTTKASTVDIIATNLTIDSGWTIDVSWLGYDEKQWVGSWWTYSSYGWWGAYGGNWGNWNGSSVWGTGYGSATGPNSLWSWGWEDWGSGGGSIKVDLSWNLTINWTIKADWNNYFSSYWGGGAWGSIWLDTGTLAWNWSISADWGNWYGIKWGWGGGWRVALYFNSATFDYINSVSVDYWEGGTSAEDWGVWTIYTYNKSDTSEFLYVRNIWNTVITNTLTELEWSITSVKDIIIWDGAYVGEFNNVVASSSVQATNSMITTNASWEFNMPNSSVTIWNWATLTHHANSDSKVYSIDLIASNLTVDSWGSIDVWGKGYAMRQWEGLGVTYSYYGWGWAYGGNWGDWNSLAVWGSSYGFPSTPTYLGSGWGEDWGSWWGAMKIVVSWTLTINWDIKANWNNYSSSYWGGGAWGSIWLDAGILAWNWTISANWGNWYSNSWGWGGGGRIALYFGSATFDYANNISIIGWNGGTSAQPWEDWTIYTN